MSCSKGRRIAVGLAVLVIVGCARRGVFIPGQTSLSDFKVPAPAGQVFQATLSVAQKLNLNVAVLEKSSGFLRFEKRS